MATFAVDSTNINAYPARAYPASRCRCAAARRSRLAICDRTCRGAPHPVALWGIPGPCLPQSHRERPATRCDVNTAVHVRDLRCNVNTQLRSAWHGYRSSRVWYGLGGKRYRLSSGRDEYRAAQSLTRCLARLTKRKSRDTEPRTSALHNKCGI
jgi:hypothetical protein